MAKKAFKHPGGQMVWIPGWGGSQPLFMGMGVIHIGVKIFDFGTIISLAHTTIIFGLELPNDGEGVCLIHF